MPGRRRRVDEIPHNEAAAGRTHPRPTALAKLPAVPMMTNPPESALPDLVPLPAWG